MDSPSFIAAEDAAMDEKENPIVSHTDIEVIDFDKTDDSKTQSVTADEEVEQEDSPPAKAKRWVGHGHWRPGCLLPCSPDHLFLPLPPPSLLSIAVVGESCSR